MKSGHFETHVHNERVQVIRHFDVADGTIDLNLTFTPSGGSTNMTLGEVHQASLNIAIQRLQELLEASKAAAAAQSSSAR